MTDTIRIPCLCVQQTPTRRLYTFAIDGKQLDRFATVSRIKRGDAGDLSGYQRPEVLSHIAEIRTYLESSDPLLPNALVIAFDGRVSFTPSGSATSLGYVTPGELMIPVEATDDPSDKPGWIVDGQQRAAAVRDADVTQFPVCVTAFIAEDVREQREQFILVNSTKPLPKGLIYELLPETESRLPTLLQRRRFPALLVSRLNLDADSPFRGLVATPTTPEGLVKDNSLLRMIENSLSDGLLYRLRDTDGEVGAESVELMLEALKRYWRSVAAVFMPAWGLPPRKSRLMHGVGITAMGFIMDAIAGRHADEQIPTEAQFVADLTELRPVCRWTDSYWDFGPGAQRKWNELQNTAKDIALLSNYLLYVYRERVWNDVSRQRREAQPA